MNWMEGLTYEALALNYFPTDTSKDVNAQLKTLYPEVQLEERYIPDHSSSLKPQALVGAFVSSTYDTC